MEGGPRGSRRTRTIALAASIVLVAGTVTFLTFGHRTPPSPITGMRIDRIVPSIPLVDQRSAPVSFRSFRGRIVVLAPFLTSCREVCPLTAGAFVQMYRDVVAAGMGSRVAFVEITVDPWRDTPQSLGVYARRAGLAWDHLLTGTPANIRRLWSFFGVYYRRVPFPSRRSGPSRSARTSPYDVVHEDDVFFLDPSGHERIVLPGMPDLAGRIAPALKKLLDRRGRRDLLRPQASWTVPEALGDLGQLLGHPIPAR